MLQCQQQLVAEAVSARLRAEQTNRYSERRYQMQPHARKRPRMDDDAISPWLSMHEDVAAAAADAKYKDLCASASESEHDTDSESELRASSVSELAESEASCGPDYGVFAKIAAEATDREKRGRIVPVRRHATLPTCPRLEELAYNGVDSSHLSPTSSTQLANLGLPTNGRVSLALGKATHCLHCQGGDDI
ncbi:unnamed protein product [Protopolystoma xenopodis]|uniref:Uncharacterized protein n=1 Tax=Protopolystoma xenopodis TaxID=117903 RepID=A0A3S5AJ54_9PLAT|nr:unnamed protein product [Protopolystoma xenopodis]